MATPRIRGVPAGVCEPRLPGCSGHSSECAVHTAVAGLSQGHDVGRFSEGAPESLPSVDLGNLLGNGWPSGPKLRPREPQNHQQDYEASRAEFEQLDIALRVRAGDHRIPGYHFSVFGGVVAQHNGVPAG